MINITRLNTEKAKAVFQIQPFVLGSGTTIGNLLRRVLDNELTGFAITAVRIDGVSSEYSLAPFLYEDVLQILTNLRGIILKESIYLTNPLELYYDGEKSESQREIQKIEAFFDVQGPCIVTAGMLKLPRNTFMVLNPEHYICTIVENKQFFCEVEIEAGRGFRTHFESTNRQKYQPLDPSKPTTLRMDSNFSPVLYSTFEVKQIRDKDGSFKESLEFLIATKGTRSPQRCLFEGVKIAFDFLYTFVEGFELLQYPALQEMKEQKTEDQEKEKQEEIQKEEEKDQKEEEKEEEE